MVVSTHTPHLTIQIAHSIDEIDPQKWDDLAANRPFQSHRWYCFGEKVMADCEPIYLLAHQGEKLVGRAALWVIRNEPLPQYVGNWRIVFEALLRRWPLLICRSPLANASGLILPENPVLREETLAAFTHATRTQGKQKRCSAIVFDYLGKSEKIAWPSEFSKMEVPDSGTIMQNRWSDFDEYLESGNKKDRQHYKRTLREAGKLNIKITRHSSMDNADQMLPLIRNVERQYHAPSNPWASNMLGYMEMVDGIFLTASVGEKPVGCGLLLEDNASQMTSVLGLAKDVPYVYFMLVYESLKVAFEHKVRFLRWGSGAYDVKQRLGFELEDNSSLAFFALNPILQKALLSFK